MVYKSLDNKRPLTALNKKINWKPKETGEKRFGNWLANANDWNLSRYVFGESLCRYGEVKMEKRR